MLENIWNFQCLKDLFCSIWVLSESIESNEWRYIDRGILFETVRKDFETQNEQAK